MDSSGEREVFFDHYIKLLNVIDVNHMLLHFVSNRQIALEDKEDILKSQVRTKQAEKLLRHISARLEAGDVAIFYDMLKIMEGDGDVAAQELASQIKKALTSTNQYGMCVIIRKGNFASNIWLRMF